MLYLFFGSKINVFEQLLETARMFVFRFQTQHWLAANATHMVKTCIWCVFIDFFTRTWRRWGCHELTMSAHCNKHMGMSRNAYIQRTRSSRAIYLFFPPGLESCFSRCRRVTETVFNLCMTHRSSRKLCAPSLGKFVTRCRSESGWHSNRLCSVVSKETSHPTLIWQHSVCFEWCSSECLLHRKPIWGRWIRNRRRERGESLFSILLLQREWWQTKIEQIATPIRFAFCLHLIWEWLFRYLGELQRLSCRVCMSLLPQRRQLMTPAGKFELLSY